jgi:hypothetical protein
MDISTWAVRPELPWTESDAFWETVFPVRFERKAEGSITTTVPAAGGAERAFPEDLPPFTGGEVSVGTGGTEPWPEGWSVCFSADGRFRNEGMKLPLPESLLCRRRYRLQARITHKSNAKAITSATKIKSTISRETFGIVRILAPFPGGSPQG